VGGSVCVGVVVGGCVLVQDGGACAVACPLAPRPPPPLQTCER